MRRWLIVSVCVLSASCARHRLSSVEESRLFTGAACTTERLRFQFEGGWREVRTLGYTYCVPPEVTPENGAGQYWDSQRTKFAWGRDPRVLPSPATTSFAAVTQSGRVVMAPGEASDDSVFPESIAGAPARVSTIKVNSSYYVRVDFRDADLGLAFYGKATSEAGTAELLTVIRSVRFTR